MEIAAFESFWGGHELEIEANQHPQTGTTEAACEGRDGNIALKITYPGHPVWWISKEDGMRHAYSYSGKQHFLCWCGVFSSMCVVCVGAGDSGRVELVSFRGRLLLEG